jgi:hypothetical protein
MKLGRVARLRPSHYALGHALQRMARPVCKSFLTSQSDQATSTYPVSGHRPGQDGDPRVPVLISIAASSAIERHRVPEHRSTVRPSRFHHPQTSYSRSRRMAPASDLVRYGATAAPASNPLPLRKTAQTTRANLAASVTTTVLWPSNGIRELSAEQPRQIRRHGGCVPMLPNGRAHYVEVGRRR